MTDPATFTDQAGISALIIIVIQYLKRAPWFKGVSEDSSNFIKRVFLVIGSGIGALGLSISYNQHLGQMTLAGFEPGVPLKIALLALGWKWFCSAAVTHGAYQGIVKNDIVGKIVAALQPPKS